MELRQKDINRLETMFARECQIAIDTLAYHGMSEEQYATFETCLNTFIKYNDLKDFISGTLLSKIKEASRFFYPDKKENWFSFRKLVRLLIKFSDEESVDVFVSFLLTGRRPHHFFVLLEEMVSNNMNTASAQKVFESLIATHNYDLDIINKYMSVIKQDAYGFTKRLVENSHYGGLCRYIRTLGLDMDRKKLLGEQIVPSVIENYIGDRTHYMGITMSVAECGADFLKELLHDNAHIGECEEYFGKYLVSNHAHNILLIKHFMAYLEINNPTAIPSLEESFLKDIGVDTIYRYGIEVPISNKRKVLIRLIELKNEKYLVEFIKKFPAYQSLMPML